MNYEYRGEFLYTEDGQLFNQKGYTKFASDFTDVLLNDLVKIEFRQFKEKLGL
jgi:hypothetical protein